MLLFVVVIRLIDFVLHETIARRSVIDGGWLTFGKIELSVPLIKLDQVRTYEQDRCVVYVSKYIVQYYSVVYIYMYIDGAGWMWFYVYMVKCECVTNVSTSLDTCFRWLSADAGLIKNTRSDHLHTYQSCALFISFRTMYKYNIIYIYIRTNNYALRKNFFYDLKLTWFTVIQLENVYGNYVAIDVSYLVSW